MKKRNALMVGFFAIATVISSLALIAMIPKPINKQIGIPVRRQIGIPTPEPFTPPIQKAGENFFPSTPTTELSRDEVEDILEESHDPLTEEEKRMLEEMEEELED